MRFTQKGDVGWNDKSFTIETDPGSPDTHVIVSIHDDENDVTKRATVSLSMLELWALVCAARRGIMLMRSGYTEDD